MQTSFVALLAVAASLASALPHGGNSYEASLPEPTNLPEPTKLPEPVEGPYKPKPPILPEPIKDNYKPKTPILPEHVEGPYKPKLPEPTTGDPKNNTLPVPTCVDGKIKTHKVKSGESLTTIAEKYDTGICNIAKLNNLADPNFVDLNQDLQIPTDACEKDNTSCIKPDGTATCVKDGKKDGKDIYSVVSGDTLTSIAQALQITLQSLKDANPGVVPEHLNVGQKLNVPVC
uniref:Intracellular hyphae protein 1 n=1 Tax=Colletotrichum lindemuthianum TaxID=290576 RepID=CIH1_COLLN|nr:RecName: Full=Intracellular hyphae protein 1; Flags: Precursor [Colletotrichum lindemuthianum]CAC00481.1 intracellular hyphae protein 1 [Colletotrichum lindemuthianum]